MATRSFRLALALAGVLLAANGRAADTLRCATGRLVDVGMFAAEVVARCGEPRSRSVEEVPVLTRTRNGNVVQTGTTRTEHWTYARGYGQFDALLTFEEGKLVRIDLLTGP